ncbi:MAG TPA: DNA repair protein RecO [bacterium]|nr:DNA repair protein RecO [bacterium]
MPPQKTQGIVLGFTDWHETSKIVAFYTKDFGKIRGVAKGARRKKSKFSPLEILSHHTIVFYKREDKDLYTLSECQAEETFPNIRKDIKKVAYGAYLVELVAAVSTSEKNEPLFDLFSKALHFLEKKEDFEIIIRAFETRLLDILGFGLQLDSCLICKKELKVNFKLNPGLGGLICIHHLQDGIRLSEETRRFLKSPGIKKVSSETRKELKTVLQNSILYHIGKRLKSLDFLEAIERE